MIIHIALVLELVALWLERMVPGTHAFLPLGGDHFTQLAALVVLAVIVLLGRELGRRDRSHSDDPTDHRRS